MKTHPQETMEKLKTDEPEILHWLMEFLGVMGDHFVTLGYSEEGGSEKKNNVQKNMTKTEEPKVIREMGPLEEKAMRVQKAQHTSNSQQQMQHNEKKIAGDEEVNRILSNDVLRSILLDPKMQQVMEELASESGVGAGKLQYYMRHDDFGPKLRLLVEAGLLKMA